MFSAATALLVLGSLLYFVAVPHSVISRVPGGPSVTFEQSGLSGRNWSVTMIPANGTPRSESSTTGTLSWQLPLGIYGYEVVSPPGFRAIPSIGSLVVRTAEPSTIRVTFTGAAIPSMPIDHVILIVLENQGVDQTYGVLPFETHLANAYSWGGNAVTQAGGVGYYAVCHPSAPNYLALTSGQPDQCGSDGYTSYSTNNLGNLLDSANLSWVAYTEAATVPCQMYDAGNYVVRHDPFAYYADLGGNASGSPCEMHVWPTANLTTGFPFSTPPPAFTFIAPDLLDDGHNSSAVYADTWLSGFVSRLVTQSWFASTVVFVVYDESYGTNANGGYNGLTGGPVYMVAVSPFTVGIGALATNCSHYSLLSTIEWLLGLGSTGSGEDGTSAYPAMKALFNATVSGSVAGRASGMP